MAGGYTPVFDTIFTGSLCGHYPDTAAWLFLLALADKHGVVDKSPAYIASVTGIPEQDLRECIERFMQPDPESRTATDEGRRLELIDPERPWGWRIINFGKYRERARKRAWDEERTASNRDAERKRQQREADRKCPDASRRVPTNADDSRLSPPSNTDTNPSTSRAAARPTDDEFEAFKLAYPKRSGSQRWSDARKAIRARLREEHTLDDILDGARRYASWLSANGKSGTEFVMQAATFCGSNRSFLDAWEVTADGGETTATAAARLGITRRSGESDDSFERRVANALTAEIYQQGPARGSPDR